MIDVAATKTLRCCQVCEDYWSGDAACPRHPDIAAQPVDFQAEVLTLLRAIVTAIYDSTR